MGNSCTGGFDRLTFLRGATAAVFNHSHRVILVSGEVRHAQ